MALSTKQSGVFRGMALAVVIVVAGLLLGALVFPAEWLPGGLIEAKLAFAGKCLLVLSFWLLIFIGLLARHRFFTPEDIDGSGLTSGTDRARVLQAILQNTLEQVTLAALVYTAFAVLAPGRFLGALPAAAVLFSFGRSLFWHGYAKGAAARSFGFALTFYSTLLLFVATVVLLPF